MINPAKLLQLKSAWGIFSGNHPKFVKFLNDMSANGIQEGTIIEINVTRPDGQTSGSNLKVNASDVELFRSLSELVKK